MASTAATTAPATGHHHWTGGVGGVTSAAGAGFWAAVGGGGTAAFGASGNRSRHASSVHDPSGVSSSVAKRSRASWHEDAGGVQGGSGSGGGGEPRKGGNVGSCVRPCTRTSSASSRRT